MTASTNTADGAAREPTYYPAIDSLRAMAVLSVVLYHLDKRLVPGGFIGVDVFFVVSGYVVSLTMARYGSLGLGAFIANFYARRLLRISPALVVCLLVTALASCLFIPRAWLSESNTRTALAAFLGLSNFVLSRSDNAYFEPRAELNPFTHTWSLAVEEQFYVVFPLLFWALVCQGQGPRGRSVARVVLALLTLGSLACCAWWTATRPHLAFYMLPARFWELGLGVGLFVTTAHWAPIVKSIGHTSAKALTAAALLVLLAVFFVLPEEPFPFPGALFPALTTVVLIALIVGRERSPAPSFLVSPIPLWLGKVSYSLYLWHWPVLVLLRWTVGLESPGAKLFALVLSLLLASASYYGVELPLRNAPRLRKVPRHRLALGGVVSVLVATGVAGFTFQNQNRLSLSVTAENPIWLPENARFPENSQPRACRLEQNWQPFGGGGVQTIRPAGCNRPRGALYVVGDSHAGAYVGMLALYAEASGHDVTVLTRGGCSLFDLSTPPSGARPDCLPFDAEVLAFLNSKVRSGDVLFLPGLRVARFADQWGGVKQMDAPDVQAAKLQRGTAEVSAILRELSTRGVSVLLEAPKPLFKAPPFRCADWFNASHPVCKPGFDLPRSELETRRAPVLASMREVVGKVPRTSIWDPAPILCPGTTCHAFLDGQPLYFDGDHLSGGGNQLLLSDFSRTLDAVFSNADAADRPAQ